MTTTNKALAGPLQDDPFRSTKPAGVVLRI